MAGPGRGGTLTDSPGASQVWALQWWAWKQSSCLSASITRLSLPLSLHRESCLPLPAGSPISYILSLSLKTLLGVDILTGATSPQGGTLVSRPLL